MSDKSKIEWTATVNADGSTTPGSTWNPVRGCVKVSAGCKNCYAETFAERWRGVPGHPYEQGFDLRLVPEKLLEPLKWKKPRRVFVNSMSDLFQDGVPDSYINHVFAVMAVTERHTYQILTKRPKRMLAYFRDPAALRDRIFHCLLDTRLFPGDPRRAVLGNPSRAAVAEGISNGWRSPSGKNVWLGVSCESQATYKDRALYLANTPAAVRFISFEPLLEDIGDLMLDGIFEGAYQWAIVGGESGPGARPMQPEWARSVRDQCVAAGVPFFFKQWGGVQKKKAGRELDGREWNEFPGGLSR